MKNAIIIHGCSSSSEDSMDFNARPYPQHWITWVRETLIVRGIPAITPMMPESWVPNYEKWKAEFEKQEVGEGTTLVGHSCGCAFLVRWLGDSQRKIDKLILVAPWKIAREGNEIKKLFYEYPIDETIKSRVNKIVFFTADNEEENGKKSLVMYHDVLGGKIIELQGRRHYAGDDNIKTIEFPELLAEILD